MSLFSSFKQAIHIHILNIDAAVLIVASQVTYTFPKSQHPYCTQQGLVESNIRLRFSGEAFRFSTVTYLEEWQNSSVSLNSKVESVRKQVVQSFSREPAVCFLIWKMMIIGM